MTTGCSSSCSGVWLYGTDTQRVTQKRSSTVGATASEDRSTAGIEVWEEADATSFKVRGANYAKDGKKFNSKGSIYRCA